MKIFSNLINNKYYLFSILLFYTIFTSFLIQQILLPNFFPGGVSNQGLLKGFDSIRYHEMSVLLSNKIDTLGWQEWELLPYGERHFVVGITSIFYTLIAPEAWVMIPINAFIHVLTVFILLRIALFFTDKYYIALLAVTPYMFFPSAAFWYSQLLKDGYYNLGAIMFCYGWMYISYIDEKPSSKSLSILVGPVCILLGYLLMGLIRTYSLSMMMVLSLLIFLIMIIMLLFSINKKELNWQQYFKKIFLAIFCLLMIGKIQDYLINNEYVYKKNNDGTIQQQLDLARVQPINKTFHDDGWFQTMINNKVSKVTKIRQGYIETNILKNTKSAIDLDINFKNSTEIFLYTPRALQISFLSPFPNMWFQEGMSKTRTVMRSISMFEMLLAYISYLFFPLIFKYWLNRSEFWIALFYSSSVITLYATVVPNIGTLYRFRYPYLMILISILIITAYNFLHKKYLLSNKKI